MHGLKIYFRQHQLKDIDNGNIDVVVDCGTSATYVPGTVPKPNWEEMTEYTDGLEKLQLTWDSVNQSSSSVTNAAGSNYDKGISLELTFWGTAFQYIWDWLLTTQCQMLNSIDVKIEDTLCEKNFRVFEIKMDNLEYEPEDNCRFVVRLREQDLVWHCIHKTMIWDNHQNWFNQTGTSTKDHPTFMTCIEPRPRILNSVRVALLFFVQSNPAVGTIGWLTGGNIKDDIRRILELENFVPAPLIRTYIDNVADRCGMDVDTIFHRVGTPEYNVCLFHPASGEMYQNDGDSEVSPSTKFIFENRWNTTLPELLDKLKAVYAAEWYVTPNNTIVFKPLSELIALAPIADLTVPGAMPVRDLKYSFGGKKKAAYGRYQYSPDGSDLGSQEIANLYNDIVDYDGPQRNPMLEGEKTKQFEFAPTAFVRDGRTKDYIRMLINDGETGAYVLLGILLVIIAALFAGTLSAGAGIALGVTMAVWAVMISEKSDNMRDYFTSNAGNYTGAVRLVSGNQTMAPRLLYWNGVAMNRAKVTKTNAPAPDAYYNPDSVPYATNNKISTDNGPLNIFNYEAYFDSRYQGNLYGRFHDEIDNPLKSLETNQSFKFTTDLCCDTMDLLGLWESDFVKIGYLLKLEKRANYDVYGRIENISVSYEDYTITIKGKVIRK